MRTVRLCSWCVIMTVARARFAGTHLENAPQWLLEIEALTMGGWSLKVGPRVKVEDGVARHRSGQGDTSGPERTRSAPLQRKVSRTVRVAEPRAAPRPMSAVRHHHFEQKIILASAKGTISVAERRAAYGEGFNASDAIIPAEVRATNEAAYTEGHKSTEAERVVYTTATNGETYEERMAFWDLANENAHFVGPHTIAVRTAGVEAAWDRATRDATMPDVLREAVAKARMTEEGQACITVNDAGVVKRWLAKRTRSFPSELRDQLTLKTPHNSRIAYSIVGQFAHGMSLPGMRGCLDELVGEFTARGIPCQAVIHEPTAKNSRKNWHFHLIYYAGEAERLPDGRWSFERENRRDKWGTMKSVPLKRLGRNAEVAAADWVPKLKKRWSEIVNARAIAEGIETRFTNQRNDERGLPKPQTRYSPGRQALHAQGHFTDVEIAQNIETWQLWRKRKAKQLRDATDPLRREFELLRRRAEEATLSSRSRQQVQEQLDRGALVLADVNALTDTAVHAATLRHMFRSGPDATVAHYSAVVEALGRKSVTPARTEKRMFAHAACDAAETYLATLNPTLQRLERTQQAAVAKLREARGALRRYFPGIAALIDEGERVQSLARVSKGQSATSADGPAVMTPRSRQAMAAHLASGRGMG